MIIALICKKKMPSKDYLGRKITFAMCIMLLGATLGLYILFIVMMMFMTYVAVTAGYFENEKLFILCNAATGVVICIYI